MGGLTKHGLPYPVGTDLIMEGDNAMQALAEKVDTLLYADGQPASRAAPGIWMPATGCFLVQGTSPTQHPGSVVTEARYMMIGNTVFLTGSSTVGATACIDLAVKLPNALTGFPRHRHYNCGVYVITGTGAPVPPAQMFVGQMTSGNTTVTAISATGGFTDAPANTSARWNFVYEVLPPPADMVDLRPESPEGGTLPGPTDENDEEA